MGTSFFDDFLLLLLKLVIEIEKNILFTFLTFKVVKLKIYS